MTLDEQSTQSSRSSSLASLLALWWLTRAALTAAILLAVLSVFSAAIPLSPAFRLIIALTVVIALPLLLRRWLRRRATKKPALGWWYLAGVNLVFCALLCQSFPAAVGKGLHDNGSWWLGDLDGWFPRRYQRATKRLGSLLQGDFRPKTPVVARPTPPRPEPTPKPEPTKPPQDATLASQRWHSPVSNLRACLPRRARRCRKRRCDVKLHCPASTEVAAAAAGVVVAVGEDHIALEHAGGKFRTEYHQLSLQRPIQVGAPIKQGQQLGASDHLRFSLGVKRGERYRYVDPVPALLLWEQSG